MVILTVVYFAFIWFLVHDIDDFLFFVLLFVLISILT